MTVLLYGNMRNQAGPRLGSRRSVTSSIDTGPVMGGCSPYAYTLFINVDEWLQLSETVYAPPSFSGFLATVRVILAMTK